MQDKIKNSQKRPPNPLGKGAWGSLLAASLLLALSAHAAPSFEAGNFAEKYCVSCHDGDTKSGNLDLTSLPFEPNDAANLRHWINVYDRVQAGEMPPKKKARPALNEQNDFVRQLAVSLNAYENQKTAREGRATQRRLNGYEYENALRDLFEAPWLQVRGQFPDDGEAFRFNKIGDALDVSHVHMARYISAADYAIRQALSVKFTQPPTTTKRYYARDQKTLINKFTQTPFNSSPDRQTYPVLGSQAQSKVRSLEEPLTVGEADPKTRDLEAVGWVSSNYVTGFTYSWDKFRAPVAGRYRIRFSGYTLWAAPGGVSYRFASGKDKIGKPGSPNSAVPNYDEISPGRTNEPITVYTRNGLMNRRVGGFDLTPEPTVYELDDVWLLANETLVPDASRFYRSRPPSFRNPLMTKDGAPSVAFRWMEVEGPLYDASSTDGYKLLFGDLPLREARNGEAKNSVTIPIADADKKRDSVTVEVVPKNPRSDAENLLRGFLKRAYVRPVEEADVKLFLALYEERSKAGLSFTEAMLATYTAVLASPKFVYLYEKQGRLDDYALATRLSLFLWNSLPDEALRARAAKSELNDAKVLRAETERLLNDDKSRRFVDAFLDYWLDIRKIEDSTPSTTLYNDYYLDDALTEAALLESQLFFDDMIKRDQAARNIVDADYAFLNERLAEHYDVPAVKGIEMRRVNLPQDSPRGGFMTQAAVLKVTANGTTTSPVLRGKWIMERILGNEIPPPPPVAAVEPDIRGAVTIRQQLEKHRADSSCATCHSKMDPPGFALESFDVMGGWRDKYRGVDENKPAEKGRGKNGQAFVFHLGLPVDSSGQLPDGRAFSDIRDFKKLLRGDEEAIARNLARQLTVYATGAPVRFSDRAQIEQILQGAKANHYGARTLIHQIVQSDLFRNK